MPKKPERKIATSFRLSRNAYLLLKGLVVKTGLARTAVLELAIRKLANKEGLYGVPLRVQVTPEQKEWFDAEVARMKKKGL